MYTLMISDYQWCAWKKRFTFYHAQYDKNFNTCHLVKVVNQNSRNSVDLDQILKPMLYDITDINLWVFSTKNVWYESDYKV